MKAIHEHFRCDLCGRFSNFGVTESYALPQESGDPSAVSRENTVCVRCISNATALLLDGMIAVTEVGSPMPTEGSSSE